MAKILVIDDDELVRDTLRGMLEDDGHEVTDACDGADGIEKFRDDPADLVVTDIIMPGKEGIQTIWELKNDAPDLKIVAISGGVPGAPDSDLPLAEAFGASCTLQKPFGPIEFLRTVSALLNERDAQPQRDA